MFESHIALGMNLLVLVAAAGLLGFAAKTDACCKTLMKSVAYGVLVLGVLNILCTSYYTVRYWEDGYFKTPHGKQCSMMGGKGGMKNMMDDGMMKMMNGMKGKTIENKDHEEHHPDQE